MPITGFSVLAAGLWSLVMRLIGTSMAMALILAPGQPFRAGPVEGGNPLQQPA
jgi:hypothetical protein